MVAVSCGCSSRAWSRSAVCKMEVMSQTLERLFMARAEKESWQVLSMEIKAERMMLEAANRTSA